MNKYDQEDDVFNERIANRKAAMELARESAIKGNPICGAFFAILNGIRKDPLAEFMEDFYEYEFEDDSDDIRPY